MSAWTDAVSRENPIIQRELVGMLRTRKALALMVSLSAVLAVLVVLRWPTDARVATDGAGAQQVFRVFGYGLMTMLILLVPVFPATTIVREKVSGTLALLLNSPMSPWAIYAGKLVGVLGFVLLLLAMSLPAAAACYAMGGIGLFDHLLKLYLLLLVVAVQYATLGLLVSSHASSTDSALRMTYGLILVLAVVVMGPHLFLQGGPLSLPAQWLRCVSPIPAVMEAMGHGGVGSAGIGTVGGAGAIYLTLAVLSIAGLIYWTASRLNQTMFDRARPQGLITDDRAASVRAFRRIYFLWFFDPQRRSGMIGPLTNPIMVKEFRCRRFGRSYWIIRMVAVCGLISLLLTYASTLQTMSWGTKQVGGIMVLLQVALIVLLTPSLASGLISSERESGGWTLLQMTPLPARTIVAGKLASVIATLVLILFATLPGYVVMIVIDQTMLPQITRVLVSLLATAVFALVLSAAVSSLCRRTAPATVISYTLLVLLCAGTMLFWLGADAPFSHAVVENALKLNPMAAALTILDVPQFKRYHLIPANWWIMGGLIVACVLVLAVQTYRLTRPQ